MILQALYFYYLLCINTLFIILRATFFKDILKISCIYFQREEKGGRKRRRETCTRETQIGCLSHGPTGDLVRNAGTCSDREWNQRPLVSQASTQSTEPHQPGLKAIFSYAPNYVLIQKTLTESDTPYKFNFLLSCNNRILSM